MKTIVVLAMHGMPPHNFPESELGELFRLHSQLDKAPAGEQVVLKQRYTELDARVRSVPRTARNDPYCEGSQRLAAHLSQATGHEVILGFNEFCAPSLDEALDQAAVRGAGRIVVITPMMTPGGEHSEVDIPAAIRRAQERYPDIHIVYAWPFSVSEVAYFLAAQLWKFIREDEGAFYGTRTN